MKKLILLFAIATLTSGVFTSCEKDDEINTIEHDLELDNIQAEGDDGGTVLEYEGGLV